MFNKNQSISQSTVSSSQLKFINNTLLRHQQQTPATERDNDRDIKQCDTHASHTRTNTGGPVSSESVSNVTDAVETAEQINAVAISTDTSHLTTLVHVYTNTHASQ